MEGSYSFASCAIIGNSMFLLVMVIFLKGIFADLFYLKHIFLVSVLVSFFSSRMRELGFLDGLADSHQALCAKLAIV